MTDTHAGQPFDPQARVRVGAYLRARSEIGQGDIIASIPTPSGIMSLRASDLDQEGAQLAYVKDENRLLAEKCADLRGQHEDVRAKLEAVRKVANEWRSWAIGEGTPEPHPVERRPMAHVLNQVLHALDGDQAGTGDGVT